MTEGFIYFECPDCGFDCIQRSDFRGSYACPLCAGDSGHDVAMRSRECTPEDGAVEGFDARKGTRAAQMDDLVVRDDPQVYAAWRLNCHQPTGHICACDECNLARAYLAVVTERDSWKGLAERYNRVREENSEMMSRLNDKLAASETVQRQSDLVLDDARAAIEQLTAELKKAEARGEDHYRALLVSQALRVEERAALLKALPPLEHILAQAIPPDCPPEMAAKVRETLAYRTMKDRVDSVRAALGRVKAPDTFTETEQWARLQSGETSEISDNKKEPAPE